MTELAVSGVVQSKMLTKGRDRGLYVRLFYIYCSNFRCAVMKMKKFVALGFSIILTLLERLWPPYFTHLVREKSSQTEQTVFC